MIIPPDRIIVGDLLMNDLLRGPAVLVLTVAL
jgi:hypothetical protein